MELLVVLGVVVILAALLLSTQNRMRESMNSTRCLSNLKTVGTALMTFAADNNGLLPPTAGYLQSAWIQSGWSEFLQVGGYLPNGSAAFCPAMAPKVTVGQDLRTVNPDAAPYSLGHFSYGLRSDHPGKISPPYERWGGSWDDFSWDGKVAAPIFIGRISSPSKSILVSDSYSSGYSKPCSSYRYDAETADWSGVNFAHGEGKVANTLFADGHVQPLTLKEMAKFLEDEGGNASYWNGQSFQSIR